MGLTSAKTAELRLGGVTVARARGRLGQHKLTQTEKENLLYKIQESKRFAKRTGGFEDSIVLWKAQKALTTATLLTWKVSEQLKLFTALRAEIWEWIDSYETNEKAPGEGFALFKRHWKLLRLGIGLQVRLLVEQILYDRGEPWSRLCTGFGSIGD